MGQLPKIKKLYYSIGEVSELTGLKSYVLRYWETEFSKLSPSKNRSGNRTYRQKDIDLIMKIKSLLYDKKYTIEGARIEVSNKKKHQDDNLDEYKKSISSYIVKINQELQTIIKIINE
tara:strand:- start:410 stop:763 length:354 start_codon:yes stop_codon:yes gene_type:complete